MSRSEVEFRVDSNNRRVETYAYLPGAHEGSISDATPTRHLVSLAAMDDDDPARHTMDRAAILARRQHFIRLALTAALATTPLACAQPCLSLAPGYEFAVDGVYVCYVRADIDCPSCAEFNRGDIIQAVDGIAVVHPDQFEASLADGRSHTVTSWARETRTERTTQLQLSSSESPFRTASTHDLDQTPRWARRSLFTHASPRLQLIDLDGRSLSGEDLLGTRHLLVMFDWATAADEATATVMLRVMQKAAIDLEAIGVDLLLAHVPPPSSTGHPPMSAADLHRFFIDAQLPESEGGPLPPPRLLRLPNPVEAHPTRALGLEGEFTYRDALRAPPNIVVLDERGIIRWHSAGLESDPTGALPPAQYTIISAVTFALSRW